MSSRFLRATTLVVFSLGCSHPTNERTTTSRATVVGTPASILEEATRAGSRAALRSFAFATDTGERIPVVSQEYEFTGDYLAVTGTAHESERASFLLKGDSNEIYGWIVLPDRDLAYEYTTTPQGEVVVEAVPVTKIFPVCNDPPAAEVPPPLLEPPAANPTGDPPHVGPYTGADPNKLQSRPGATKVLFMDVSSLSLSREALWEAWQIVAASFSAFDINVTTDEAVYEATELRNSGKACMHDEDGRSSCGVNAFGTTRCCNVYNKGNGHYQGLATTHELGHLMGLSHDGTDDEEYFQGFSAYRWCPIMGQSTPKQSWGNQVLFQWSKGEYPSASSTQDDLDILSRKAPYRPDDIPTTKPLTVRAGSMVSSDDNRGQIATNTDSDTFTFEIGASGGHATLTIDRIEHVAGGYLDVDAEIRSATGMVIAQSNERVARLARFDLDLPAGRYDLVVKGGAEGSPTNGFSNYSSLGFYGISGTITGASVGGTGGSGMGGGAGMGGAAGTAGSGNAGMGGIAGSGGAGGMGGGISAGSGGAAGAAGMAGVGGVGGEAGLGGVGGAIVAGSGGVIVAGAAGAGVAGTGGASVSGSGGAAAGSAGVMTVAGAAGAGVGPGSAPQAEFADDASGCGCRTTRPVRSMNPAWLASLIVLGWLRRRRPRASATAAR